MTPLTLIHNNWYYLITGPSVLLLENTSPVVVKVCISLVSFIFTFYNIINIFSYCHIVCPFLRSIKCGLVFLNHNARVLIPLDLLIAENQFHWVVDFGELLIGKPDHQSQSP